MENPTQSRLKKLLAPLLVAAAFWALAISLWLTSGYIQPLFLFGYIGLALGVGLGLYALLPRERKPTGRRVSLLLVGIALMGPVAALGMENMQIEGVFFGLFTGLTQAAVMHYLIAKVFGPLLFGRLWCGWACWTAMILDLLPFQQSEGRLPGRWGWLRYAHFAASFGLVAVLWFGFGYGAGAAGRQAILWYAAGNALYYLSGIVLAYRLKDNRAFCKYLCPITAILKITTRFSLLKIKGNSARCSACQSCTRNCPMDIRVHEYVAQNRRVLSTECTLCQTCITSCTKEALKLSVGLDLGGREWLRERGED